MKFYKLKKEKEIPLKTISWMVELAEGGESTLFIAIDKEEKAKIEKKIEEIYGKNFWPLNLKIITVKEFEDYHGKIHL